MVRPSFLRRARFAHRAWRKRSRGYNLVMLMVMISVMNVLLAKAMPMWSHVIQREKEKEMLFRALQYAEATRVYKNRYGTWPQQLKDLTEDKGQGRTIRKLWNNPLVAEDPFGFDGEGWEILFASQPDPCATPANNGLDPSGNNGLTPPKPNDRPVQKVGPIVGVCSRERPEILAREIPNWQFTSDLINQSTYVHTESGAVFPLNSADIGRPFPGAANSPDQGGNQPFGTNSPG